MKSRRKGLHVVSSDGRHQRFLRGMITHDLVLRGIEFDTAYATARAIREDLSDRDEVSTQEIRERIVAHLETTYGIALPQPGRGSARPADGVTVTDDGHEQPFSRGLLARSIHAGGLDLDQAYRLVADLERELRAEELSTIASGEIARRVGALIERAHGRDAARRYLLVRRVHRLPRPLVIYVGGATGTGKSTLSLELAPLLRIYRINATDTIRQVMRMVFSPQILPAIHGSSFELDPGEPPDDDGPDGGLVFEEQAVRIAVGVRAVVERAIAEGMSILVEGVHLYPPLVPFPDLEGAAYQVPLVLATLDEEVHRARLSGRGRRGRRQAERYLAHLGTIRRIHEFILQQAEAHEVPLLDTSHGDPPVAAAVRIITGFLERRLPRGLVAPAVETAAPPTLLLIVDGLADRPVRALGARTPLQAADTPTLDRLAREGRCGLADPVAPGVVPDTAAGSLALFGQSPLALRRGPVEALGVGLELEPGDVALRGNFATVDATGIVIDRRAGRIRDEARTLAKALDRLTLPGDLGEEVEIRVRAATEHRLAIVLRGYGLSSAITGSDPGEGAVPGAPRSPTPTDPADERAVYTARILALFESEARQILARHPVNRRREKADLPPANAVLTRGAGRIHRLLPLEEAGLPLRITCIAGDRTVLGIAELLGSEIVRRSGMTANLDTDLRGKFKAAKEALSGQDLVVVHLKGADIAGHDQRPDLKVEFLEAVDREIAWLLERVSGPLRVAVGSDHATLSETGHHAADPLPVLVWGPGIEPDEVERFDEISVVAGGLGRLPLQMLLHRVFDLD